MSFSARLWNTAILNPPVRSYLGTSKKAYEMVSVVLKCPTATPGHASAFEPSNQSFRSSSSVSETCFGLHSGNLLLSRPLTTVGSIFSSHGDGCWVAAIGLSSVKNRLTSNVNTTFIRKVFIFLGSSHSRVPNTTQRGANG